ncbi:hypothetical protein K469DRAFT_806485, partial [Zopfia rhizophila CBS 207.26]
KGYRPKEDIWELVRNLKNSSELFNQYHQTSQKGLALRSYPKNRTNTVHSN